MSSLEQADESIPQAAITPPTWMSCRVLFLRSSVLLRAWASSPREHRGEEAQAPRRPFSPPRLRRRLLRPQPDFSRRDGREIVIVRPDWASTERTARFMTALIHASVMSAVRSGYAGGPGTKAIFDEAGSFMRLDRLGSYLDLGHGGKIGVVYVLQSRAQLAAQPGSEEAEGLWSATALKSQTGEDGPVG